MIVQDSKIKEELKAARDKQLWAKFCCVLWCDSLPLLGPRSQDSASWYASLVQLSASTGKGTRDYKGSKWLVLEVVVRGFVNRSVRSVLRVENLALEL